MRTAALAAVGATAAVFLLWRALEAESDRHVQAQLHAAADRIAQRVEDRLAEKSGGMRRFSARMARAAEPRHADWGSDAAEYLGTYSAVRAIAYAEAGRVVWCVPPGAQPAPVAPNGEISLIRPDPDAARWLIGARVARRPEGSLLFEWDAGADFAAAAAGNGAPGAVRLLEHDRLVWASGAAPDGGRSVRRPLGGLLDGWTVELIASPAWLAEASSPLPTVVLVAGLALATLLAYAAHASRRLATAAAADREQRERLAEAAAESARARALFEGIFESSPDGVILVGADGRITRVNAQAETTFRAARTDLVGRNVDDFVPSALRSGHAALRAGFLRSPRPRRMADGRGLRAVRLDGTDFPAEISLAPVTVPDGPAVIAVIRDTSDFERSREALRRSEEHYRRFFEATPSGVCTTRADGTILSCNRAFAAMFGFREPADAIGTDATRLYARPEDRARMLADAKRDGFVVARNVELRAIDGAPRCGLLNVSTTRDAAGEIVEMQSHVLDVTEERRLEGHLQRAQRLDAMGRLAGGIAHDFNNLLTVVAGCGELLLRGLPDGDPRGPLCRDILATADRASALTQQLLAFSRRQMLEPAPLDAGEVVRSLERLLRRVLGEDIALEVQCDEGPRVVVADRAQFEQVLLNLAVNSREAMPGGGRLRITVRGAGDRVLIDVSDTGSGMPPEVQERIFEPFFTTKPTGTGLGLPTVYGIVEQSGGTIEVESSPGAGTTFRLSFPASRERVAAPAAELRDQGPPSGSGVVLAVEDDRAVRELVVQALQAYGYLTIAASSCTEALRVLETEQPVNLLLTDVIMPDRGGRELADAARALRPSLPVLYMSGYAEDSMLQARLIDERGAFLRKPFTPTALARKVAKVLRDAQMAAPPDVPGPGAPGS